MIRYIIRPQHIRTTPQLLKEAFNAERTLQYPILSRLRRPSYTRDFFLCYPPISQLEDRNDLSPETLQAYASVRAFYTSNKPTQRSTLASLGFPIPTTYSSIHDMEGTGGTNCPESISSGVWIGRPFRHSGGRGYRLLRPTSEAPIRMGRNALNSSEETNPSNSWDPTQEYLQELYPKNHEYRIVIVRGTPLITLIKRVPEGTSQESPWNHAQGASFVTVEDLHNNRLRHTNIYNLINSNPFFKAIDLCGLDVLVNLRHPQPYVITELNLAPSLTIPSNIQRVVSHVNSVLR